MDKNPKQISGAERDRTVDLLNAIQRAFNCFTRFVGSFIRNNRQPRESCQLFPRTKYRVDYAKSGAVGALRYGPERRDQSQVLRAATIFAVALCPVGCARAPSSGLVIVDLDEHFQVTQMPSRRDGGQNEAVLLEAGLHYWDAVGCRFRTLEQLGPDEWDEGQHAPHIKVAYNTTPGDFEPATAGGWFDVTTGDIHLVATTLESRGDTNVYPWVGYLFATELAHELGHAMGLQHVVADGAVMNAVGQFAQGLAPADIAEFHRATGGR